jgi:uncharacterized protein (TIGR03067 family)
MKRLYAVATILALFAVRAGVAEPNAAASEPGMLVGLYKIVSGERDGQPIEAARLTDVTMRIATNAITTYDKEKKQVYAATYKLDRSRTPMPITLRATLTPDKSEGVEAPGLLAIDGQTVKLVYALPGGEAPEQMKAGPKQQLFVLQRINEP